MSYSITPYSSPFPNLLNYCMYRLITLEAHFKSIFFQSNFSFSFLAYVAVISPVWLSCEKKESKSDDIREMGYVWSGSIVAQPLLNSEDNPDLDFFLGLLLLKEIESANVERIKRSPSDAPDPIISIKPEGRGKKAANCDLWFWSSFLLSFLVVYVGTTDLFMLPAALTPGLRLMWYSRISILQQQETHSKMVP